MCVLILCVLEPMERSAFYHHRHTPGALPTSCRAKSCHPLSGSHVQHLHQLFSNGWEQRHSLVPCFHPLVSSCCSLSVVFLSKNSSLSFTTFHNGFFLFCVIKLFLFKKNPNPMASLKRVSSLPGLVYVCHVS